MNWRIRTGVLAAGAAALLSAQTAYATPASAFTMDPLVSLSALGTVQSRTAVCAAGSTAAAMAGTAAAQAAPPGCVLPVTAPAVAPVAETVPPPLAPAMAPAPGKEIGMLPILGGLALLAAIAAFILLDDDDGDGDLEPISPQ